MIDLARQTRAFCPFRGNEMGRAALSSRPFRERRDRF